MRAGQQQAAKDRNGIGAVGLSLSTSGDLDRRELQEADLNRFGVRLARVVLDRGGAIVSGHDWRPHGMMKALLNFARRYANSAEDQSFGAAALRNFVPWPDQPSLDDRDRAGLAHVLAVQALALPAWCRRVVDNLDTPDSVKDTLARLFSVSDLRRHLTEQATARVCLGGKTSNFSGRYPGIIEEVALALARNQPVYLVGWAGGASAHVISLLRGADIGALTRTLEAERSGSPAKKPAAKSELETAFAAAKARIKQQAQREIADWIPHPLRPWEWSIRDLLAFVHSKRELFSREGNGLDRKDNEALWDANTCDDSVDWIMRGLNRMRPTNRASVAVTRRATKPTARAQPVAKRRKSPRRRA